MKLRESKRVHHNWEVYWEHMQPFIYSGTKPFMKRQITLPPLLDKYHTVMRTQVFTNNKAPEQDPVPHTPSLEEIYLANNFYQEHGLDINMEYIDFNSKTAPDGNFEPITTN